MIEAKRAFSFDWLLLLLTVALVGLGLLMISSATANLRGSDVALRDQPLVRQSLFAVAGLVALGAASLINYRLWGSWRWTLYLGVVLLLGVVQILGRTLFGAQSWFDLDIIMLQPSEPCKIVLIVVLSRYFADHEAQVKRGTGIVVSLLLATPILCLVALEPDLGTAAVLLAIWLGMLFVAGLRWQHILLLALVAAVLAPAAWAVMPDHARERIMMFVQPESASDDSLYAIRQAWIGVGSGGLWGKGLELGTQSQLSFLRVRHSDYIFAVLAEELGFVGSALLLALFAGLLLRIVHVGAKAGDACGRLIASGIALMIFVQVAVNIGFHVRLLPVTGLPLPLISYGGSSLLSTLIGLGLVESVALYHQPKDPAAEAESLQVFAT